MGGYSAAIDSITKLLKAFNELDAGQKEGIGTAIAFGTAIAGANAVVLGLIGGLLKGRLTLAGMAAAMGTTTTGMAAAAAPIVVVTTAVVGLGLAFMKLSQIVEEGEQGVINALKQHEAEVRATASSYDEYAAEMKRAAEVAGYVIDAEAT